ncbi:hypothetical protein [Lampropedia puyangensis]|uniref:hypothetical protein n=1 Tax=Lampropedia puyangensis TaxID=1330072 RepID=UPI001B8734AB|nr:hypothetical protein [Lampropedia puyangensis]
MQPTNLPCHSIGRQKWRVADDGRARRCNLWGLEVQRIWIDTARKGTRLIHHQGDGRFNVDGDTLDLGERMVKWRYLMQ